MVAVRFPRSTGKTEVTLKWGVEDKEVLHLGSAKNGERETFSIQSRSPGREDRWRWRELGEGQEGGGLAVPLPQGPSFLWTTEQSTRSSTRTLSS